MKLFTFALLSTASIAAVNQTTDSTACRPPSVAITEPKIGTVLDSGSKFVVKVTATDNDQISKVELAIDGKKVDDPSVDGSKLSPGLHTLTATAWDREGLSATTLPMTFTVKPPEVRPATVSKLTLVNAKTGADQFALLGLPNNQVRLDLAQTRQMNILAEVKDGDQVQFYWDDQLVGDERTPPLAAWGDEGVGKYKPFTPTTGTHTFKAQPFNKGVAGTPTIIRIDVSDSTLGGTPSTPGSGVPDAEGWTQFRESSDTVKVYVSQTGADTNPGTEAKPVKTLAKGYALLRSGKPDWLLLKKGETWRESFPYWTKSGRSVTEPMRISSFGSGDRPIISSSTPVLITRAAVSFLAVSSLRFTDLKRVPTGAEFNAAIKPDSAVRWQSSGEYLLLEDMVLNYHGNGLSSEQAVTAPHTCQKFFKNLVVRRSIITNNWRTPVQGHSQGMYVDCVDGFKMEENFFDQNGFHSSVTGAVKTQFNHNVYSNVGNKNVVARGNIFARASATGLQQRTGGINEDNVYVQNPIGLTFGLVYGGSAPIPGGVTGVVKGNVFLEGVDMSPADPRAQALNLGNVLNVTVEDNTFSHFTKMDKPYNTLAVSVDCANGVGLKRLEVKDNAMWKWGPFFTQSNGSQCASQAVQTGNKADGFPDPERKLSTYDVDFFSRARLQSRDNWNKRYTAAELRKYIRAGFGK